VLLHLIDGTSEDVASDCEIIINELEEYGGDLVDKPRITVLNKIDALDEEEREEKRAALEEVAEGTVMMMSGATKEGVTGVLRALRAIIEGSKAEERAEQEEVLPWQP
jgi:GTP-binding protein